jgi:membrane fusion protein (multidrug efflux system)
MNVPVMWKKWLLVISGLALILGAVIGLKAAQIVSLLGFVGEMEAAGMPPVPVATKIAVAQDWEEVLRFPGSLRPIQGVTLRAEVGGVITNIAVENGANVSAGQLLLQLDASEEESQLGSAEARQRLAALNLERAKGLFEKRIVAQSEMDAAQAAFDEIASTVQSLRATIDRKKIDAPFAGQVGIREVNLGETVSAGDALIPLHSNDPIYVEFFVPQTQLAKIKPGFRLRVSADGVKEAAEGEVTVINPVIEEASRTARVQGVLRNQEGIMRPGQFVSVDVVLPDLLGVVAIPASSVVAAPYGDSVFIVEEEGAGWVARQQFIQTGVKMGDYLAVIKGLNPGDRVVSAGAFKLSNNARVIINDEMQPEAELQPNLDNS